MRRRELLETTAMALPALLSPERRRHQLAAVPLRALGFELERPVLRPL